MALSDVRPKLREAFVVGFAVFLLVIGGAAIYQFAETVGSLIVLVALLAGLGYLLYEWAL